VYRRDGDEPLRRLQAALDAGGSGAEGAALRGALSGVVWTRSMRRMFTLVERCLRCGRACVSLSDCRP
jgi:midasin